ncbi:NBR1 autophagy cargo receptor a isoform X2 [Lepisosteus oculatus]|uniref:NBR1 autophagy cargo receptor a isoform X2 n=1 Tax=Lepisosteus oculatus TaxID=7918 RepID=UPI003710B19E
MDSPVSLKAHFKGRAESLLVSDSERTRWEAVEVAVKHSFRLSDVQIKYLDEDNEEVSINSQEEYEEALKSAKKQGNRLRVNVYEVKGSSGTGERERGGGKRDHDVITTGVKPMMHCSAPAKPVSQNVPAASPVKETLVIKEVKVNRENDQAPPAWFTSYMEKFKDQLVKEAVERICQDFSERFCIQKVSQPSSEEPGSVAAQVQEVSSTAADRPKLPACQSCQAQTQRGSYLCSVCPSYTLCEQCSYGHDPTHSLVKIRTLVPPLFDCGTSVTGESGRLQKRIDKSFRKAEKQRLKAEKRQLKAEVREIKKQLRMERRSAQWSAAGEGAADPVLLQPRGTVASGAQSPKQSCAPMVPTMTAVFLDENLPDGTRLQPGTKFIKYWRMKNTGTVSWTVETKLKFMWGNLDLATGEKKEVVVPFLQPGQVGVVCVEFVAPGQEGTYTSHWRLAHRGEQFGPRVWCSIVVDPLTAEYCAEGQDPALCSKPEERELCSEVAQPHSSEKEEETPVTPRNFKIPSPDREYYIPSVDLLTAQDLLSFELLDINIVQELERVPHNTPVDMTPCMSPLPCDGPLLEKPGLGLIEEEAEGSALKPLLGVPLEAGSGPAQEEGEEDISGTQFVCETVIRSLTLEEAPDHTPPRRNKPDSQRTCLQGQEIVSSGGSPGDEPSERRPLLSAFSEGKCAREQVQPAQESLRRPEECEESDIESVHAGSGSEREGDEEMAQDDQDEVQSQGSSASEDYIIILPDCFDTSRPLGESMYSSALSQPGTEASSMETDSAPEQSELGAPEGQRAAAVPGHSVNDMLCASQTLDAVPLTPEVVPTPATLQPREESNTWNQDRSEMEALRAGERSPPPQEDMIEVSSPVQSQPAVVTGSLTSRQDCIQDDRSQGGIAGGLVKGALLVAASAYKALFTGQPVPAQPPADSASQQAAMMEVLLEMGFGDRQLNQRLLKKHNYNLLDVVNELVQMTDNDWYSTRY